jgi:hypothetical protein
MHVDHLTVECLGNCAFLLEEPILPLLKNRAGICPMYISGFVVSAKEMGLIILVALTAHYASTLVLHNGSSCISVGLSTDHYVLF